MHLDNEILLKPIVKATEHARIAVYLVSDMRPTERKGKRKPEHRRRRSHGHMNLRKDVIFDTNDRKFNTRIVTLRNAK